MLSIDPSIACIHRLRLARGRPRASPSTELWCVRHHLANGCTDFAFADCDHTQTNHRPACTQLDVASSSLDMSDTQKAIMLTYTAAAVRQLNQSIELNCAWQASVGLNFNVAFPDGMHACTGDCEGGVSDELIMVDSTRKQRRRQATPSTTSCLCPRSRDPWTSSASRVRACIERIPCGIIGCALPAFHPHDCYRRVPLCPLLFVPVL